MTRAVASAVALLAVSLTACGSDNRDPELTKAAAEWPADNEEKREPERKDVPDPAEEPEPTPPTPVPAPPPRSDGQGQAGHHDHADSSEVAEGARRIAVTATNFAFGPDEITVRNGDNVAIVLSSTDVLHDLTIDELGAHVGAEAGETRMGGFKAERPGRYTFFCSVPGHREAGMEGTLIVTG